MAGDPDEESEYERLRRRVAADRQRWPPRLPLTVIQPMAGGLHGFVPAHRHGDACRVAVHHPLWAEVAGFQYREDRRIIEDLRGATAGLVVEHDAGKAWTGIVFRPAADLLRGGGSGSGAGAAGAP